MNKNTLHITYSKPIKNKPIRAFVFFVFLVFISVKTFAYHPLEDKYDVLFYKLNFNVTNANSLFTASVEINAKAISSIDTIVFELRKQHMVIDSIYKNSTKITSFQQDSAKSLVFVPLGSLLSAGEEFLITVYYHNITGYTSNYMKTNVVSGYSVLSSMIQPFWAHEWFACKQSLTDKADSAYIFITTSDTLKVASNGRLIHIDSVSTPSFKRYEWKTLHPIEYYLISFAVGGFVEYNFYAKPTNFLNESGLQDSILIQNFLSPGNASTTAKNNILRTKNIIEKYSQEICLYPFSSEKYGHYAWNTSFVGMEHQTMSGMNNFATDLVAHELMHQWFGNKVTCKSWNDIWVHEGFAQYSQYMVQQWFPSYISANQITFFHNKALFNATTNTGSYYAGTKTKSLYVLDSEISSTNLSSNTNRIFEPPITYNKGASLVHTIRYVLQKQLNTDTLFFKVLRTYIQTFSDSVATGNDFKSILENVSGIDFTDFFNEWYYGAGYPKYNIRWSQENSNDSLYLTLEQVAPASGGIVTPYYTTPVELTLYRNNGNDTTITVYPNQVSSFFSTYVNDSIVKIAVDTADYILDDPNNKINLRCTNYISIPSFGSFCEGESFSITSSGTYTSYQWNNGVTTSSNDVSQDGTYRLTVTDSDNCRYVSNPCIVIKYPKPNAVLTAHCYSSPTERTVEVSAIGGGEPYNYQIDTDLPLSSAVFTVINGSTHSFRVQDSHSCWSDEVSFTAPNTPTTISVASSNSTCIVRDGTTTWVVYDENNNIVAEIDDNGNDIGLLNLSLFVDSTSYQENQFLAQRHFKVIAQNSLNTPIKIRFFILDSELDDIITKSNLNGNNNDDVNSINDLLILRYSGINEDDRFDNNNQECTSCYTSFIPTTGEKYGSKYLEIELSGFSEDWIVSKKSETPLGVNYLGLNTLCEGETSIIHWIAASETNNQKFLVERSNDARIYDPIGEVEGAGNSNIVKSYSFKDYMPTSDRKYYRICQIDFNGNKSPYLYTHSDCNNGELNFTITPNPTPSILQISGDVDKIIKCEFIDLISQTLYTPILQDYGCIDLSILKEGVYLLKITTEDQRVKYFKIVKM